MVEGNYSIWSHKAWVPVQPLPGLSQELPVHLFLLLGLPVLTGGGDRKGAIWSPWNATWSLRYEGQTSTQSKGGSVLGFLPARAKSHIPRQGTRPSLGLPEPCGSPGRWGPSAQKVCLY